MKSVLVINDNSVCLPFRTVISGLCTGYTSEINMCVCVICILLLMV